MCLLGRSENKVVKAKLHVYRDASRVAQRERVFYLMDKMEAKIREYLKDGIIETASERTS